MGLLVNENEKKCVVAGWARDTGTDGIIIEGILHGQIQTKSLYIHRAMSAVGFFSLYVACALTS